MKKIFWRVFVAFGVVLLVFTILIGLMFTRFNRTNIVGAYKQQLGDLADGVVTRTSQAVKDHETDEFMDYLRAMEDFGKMQNVDIWIVADESSKHKLSDAYTNVQMDGLDIPKETENIIKTAFRGKKKSYSDYDEIYQTVMLHVAVPVRDKSGDVSGAVVVSGPMEMQENTVIQYEKYMLICVMVGAFLALLLSFFFSRQLVRPIIRIKEAALVLAAGNYAHKTGIRRKDELGALAESMDTLSDKLVESGTIDCIWGCFSMDGREEVYRWAGPYMVSRQVAAVDADSSIRTLGDLAGKTIAVQSTGKPEEIFLSGSDPRIPQTVEVLSIENRSVQYAMLACGYVDGIAAHETGILQYMKDNAVDFRILEEPLLVTGLGIAFAKNDTRGLDSQLTDTLAQMRADGTLERIIGRYLENASQYLEVDTIGA